MVKRKNTKVVLYKLTEHEQNSLDLALLGCWIELPWMEPQLLFPDQSQDSKSEEDAISTTSSPFSA